jgi:hypothetical protein
MLPVSIQIFFGFYRKRDCGEEIQYEDEEIVRKCGQPHWHKASRMSRRVVGGLEDDTDDWTMLEMARRRSEKLRLA